MVMDSKIVKQLKPYVGVVFLQFGSAGFSVVAKDALNKGTSHFTFSVYRSAIAALLLAPFALFLERKIRPRMTMGVFLKLMLLGLADPVVGQNLFYAGMNLTTPTVAAALCNLIPALTFVMAWVFRIERINIKSLRSHAKIMGTAVTVGGAMIMTFFVGPILGLPWTHKPHDAPRSSTTTNDHQDQPVKGALLVCAGCTFYSLFYILQSITLKSYPAGLSLTAMICTFGAIQGTILTFIVERSNTSIWALGWNSQLLAYVYGGVVCSGFTYYLAGVIMKDKGPVFVTAFSPLNLVIVAISSSFIFAEQMSVGKVIGSVVIVMGLYLVIWGKSKDQKEAEDQQQQNPATTDLPITKASKTDQVDASDKSVSGHNAV